MGAYQTPYPKLDFFLLPNETIINMWESRIKFFSPRKVTLVVTNYRVIRIEKNVESNISRSYEDIPLKDVTSIKAVTPPRFIFLAILGYLGLIGFVLLTILAVVDPAPLEIWLCDSCCFVSSLLFIVLSKRVKKPIFISDEYREKDNFPDEVSIQSQVTAMMAMVFLILFILIGVMLPILSYDYDIDDDAAEQEKEKEELEGLEKRAVNAQVFIIIMVFATVPEPVRESSRVPS